MTQELIYTSAPQGLLPGSQGFCTVAATRGMSAAWQETLEGLSGYRPLFPPDDPRNPIAFAHWRVSASGATRSVLSRVGSAGHDYTGRTNKLAHHLILDPGERPAAGPAALLIRPGLLQSRWDGQVGWRATGPQLPNEMAVFAPCCAWERLTGDAGWAGVLAQSFGRDSRRPAVLVFTPGTDLLPLIAEALLLLPPARRWDVTFTTYFTSLPPAAECLWRGVATGTPEAKAAVRMPEAFVLDLTAPLGRAVGGPLVDAARTGRPPVPVSHAAAAIAPATPWDISRPVAAGAPPVPRADGPAWAGGGPPPPPSPLHFGPPGSLIEESPRQRYLAVWLVLLAVLIGAAGLGGMVFLQREPAPDNRVLAESQPVRSSDSQMVKGQRVDRIWTDKQRADTLKRFLAAPKGSQFLDAISLSIACTADAVDRFTTMRRAIRTCRAAWAISNRIRVGYSAFRRAVLIWRMVYPAKLFAEYFQQNKPAKQFVQFKLPQRNCSIEIAKLLSLPQGKEYSINLLPSPSAKLHLSRVNNTLTVTAVVYEGKGLDRRAVPQQVAVFQVEGGKIDFAVGHENIALEQAWRDLFDSVLEVTMANRPPSYVALRAPDHGSVSAPNAGTFLNQYKVSLEWREYANYWAQGPLLIRAARLMNGDKQISFDRDDNPPAKREEEKVNVSVDGSGQLIIEGKGLKDRPSVRFLELMRRVPEVNEPIIVFQFEKAEK
jgi:hypothetical protein